MIPQSLAQSVSNVFLDSGAINPHALSALCHTIRHTGYSSQTLQSILWTVTPSDNETPPTTIAASLIQAEVLHQQGSTSEAIGFCQRTVKECTTMANPDSADINPTNKDLFQSLTIQAETIQHELELALSSRLTPNKQSELILTPLKGTIDEVQAWNFCPQSDLTPPALTCLNEAQVLESMCRIDMGCYTAAQEKAWLTTLASIKDASFESYCLKTLLAIYHDTAYANTQLTQLQTSHPQHPLVRYLTLQFARATNPSDSEHRRQSITEYGKLRDALPVPQNTDEESQRLLWARCTQVIGNLYNTLNEPWNAESYFGAILQQVPSDAHGALKDLRLTTAYYQAEIAFRTLAQQEKTNPDVPLAAKKLILEPLEALIGDATTPHHAAAAYLYIRTLFTFNLITEDNYTTDLYICLSKLTQPNAYYHLLSVNSELLDASKAYILELLNDTYSQACNPNSFAEAHLQASIRAIYVDTSDPDASACAAVTELLDPHSPFARYLMPEESLAST